MKFPALQKASELFNKAQPDLGQEKLIAALPEISSIEVKWQAHVLGVKLERGLQLWNVVNDDALREYIDCPEPLCFGGGFRIGAIIRDMVTVKATHYRGRVRCRGQRGPSGKLRWRLCINVFKYEVRIAYKAAVAHCHSDKQSVSG